MRLQKVGWHVPLSVPPSGVRIDLLGLNGLGEFLEGCLRKVRSHTPRLSPPQSTQPSLAGIGKDHAKWQPVATVAMQQIPEITINHDLMATLTGAIGGRSVWATTHLCVCFPACMRIQLINPVVSQTSKRRSSWPPIRERLSASTKSPSRHVTGLGLRQEWVGHVKDILT